MRLDGGSSGRGSESWRPFCVAVGKMTLFHAVGLYHHFSFTISVILPPEVSQVVAEGDGLSSICNIIQNSNSFSVKILLGFCLPFFYFSSFFSFQQEGQNIEVIRSCSRLLELLLALKRVAEARSPDKLLNIGRSGRTAKTMKQQSFIAWSSQRS